MGSEPRELMRERACLCLCRETALLIDPKNSCASSRQWVALVVGHELAHQWFGNLVTMVTEPSPHR